MLTWSEIDWIKCGKANGSVLYKCRICTDGRKRAAYNCKAHETAQSHLAAVRFVESHSDNRGNSESTCPRSPTNFNEVLVDDALSHLLASWIPQSHPASSSAPEAHATSSTTGINWGAFAIEHTILDDSPEQRAIQYIAQASLNFLNGDIDEDGSYLGSDIGEGSDSSTKSGKLYLSHL